MSMSSEVLAGDPTCTRVGEVVQYLYGKRKEETAASSMGKIVMGCVCEAAGKQASKHGGTWRLDRVIQNGRHNLALIGWPRCRAGPVCLKNSWVVVFEVTRQRRVV